MIMWPDVGRAMAQPFARDDTSTGTAGACAARILGDLVATLKSLRSKPHGFGFAHRVVDKTPRMEVIHYVEVKPLPESSIIETENCE
jgi:hypothetical protein